ncbi:FkbM family methyltransferase [Aliiroseovarius sp. 2305UL8-7]|uniref:FkbM family methyltransferase n=1 Tax=Aliiroseovarius conchicola TaxID=3121637 RepID=UPI00352810DA
MPRYALQGIKLQIPRDCVNDKLEELLAVGEYEIKELTGVKRHLKPGDRVLELGGGAGYLAVQAAIIAGAANVTTVEANPQMVRVIGKNLTLNDVEGVRVMHGAVVPDDFKDDAIGFDVKPVFWASSIANGKAADDTKRVDVPALRLGALLEDVQPNLVVMDVEGAEVSLARQHWPDFVQTIIMETHPQQYPPATIRDIFDGMSAAGFAYMPWGSRGNVVVFQRI